MKMNTKKKTGTPKPSQTPRVKINDYMASSTSQSRMQQMLKSSLSKTPTNNANKIHKF